MFTSVKRHGWLTSTLRFVPVIAIAAAAMIAMAPTDARAQGFNVFTFACAANQFAVDVDARGLGNTNICVDCNVSFTLDCACVGGGGNCPTDAKKQTIELDTDVSQAVEPDNGRVDTTVDLGTPPPESACFTLSCPSGQTARLIQFEASADCTLCTTTATTGSCSCETQGAVEIATLDAPCTESDTVFRGKKDSCLARFQ